MIKLNEIALYGHWESAYCYKNGSGEKIKVQADNFSKVILLDNQSLRADKRYVQYKFASESFDLV